MAILDQGVNLAGQEINPGENAHGSSPDIFVIATKASMFAGLWRQVWRGRPDRLHARLFIIGDDRDGFAALARRSLSRGGLFENSDLAVNAQDFRHFRLEIGVAALQIIAHLVRLHFVLVEDLA
jgi:hypothetical protein